jgi:hypothetical protein
MQTNGVSSVTPTLSALSSGQASDSPVAITSSLLPEPACSGLAPGSVAALAALLTEVDQQDRTSAREIQQTTDQAALHEEDQRVQEMRQKANDDESQALMSGVAGIAGGALTVGSAFMSAPAQGSSAPNWSMAFQGAGKAAPDVGTILAAGYKASADRDDADATHFEAEADADLRTYAEAGDNVQSANDSLQKVRAFLDQMQQTENATRLAAAGYRA